MVCVPRRFSNYFSFRSWWKSPTWLTGRSELSSRCCSSSLLCSYVIRKAGTDEEDLCHVGRCVEETDSLVLIYSKILQTLSCWVTFLRLSAKAPKSTSWRADIDMSLLVHLLNHDVDSRPQMRPKWHPIPYGSWSKVVPYGSWSEVVHYLPLPVEVIIDFA